MSKCRVWDYRVKGENPMMRNHSRVSPVHQARVRRAAFVSSLRRSLTKFPAATSSLKIRAKEVMSWDHAAIRSAAYVNRRRVSAKCDVFVFDTGIDLRTRDLVRGMSISFVQSEPVAADLNGHGTAVSTIIGAVDNGLGLVGVAPGARIHSMKVLDANGEGYVHEIVNAINFMIWWKRLMNRWVRNVVVANFSLGGFVGSAVYTPIDAAIRNAVANGITCVVAAGNESDDAQLYTPAHCREAITVGSHNRLNRFSSWSNHGPSVSILAPGESVLGGDNAGGFGFTTISGTSFATPQVAGAAAYYLSRVPIQRFRQRVRVSRNRFRIVNRSRLSTPGDVNAWLNSRARRSIGQTPPSTTNSALYVG